MNDLVFEGSEVTTLFEPATLARRHTIYKALFKYKFRKHAKNDN